MLEKQVNIKKGMLKGSRYDSHVGGKGLRVSTAQRCISKAAFTSAVSR